MTIASGSAALASDLLNALDAGGQISPTAATELTIASGSITVTQLYHTVDTQSDASTDDLDTIAGGAEMDWLLIRPEHDARSIVIKHDEDNISCMGQADITLDDVEDCCLLFYDAGLTKWLAAPLTPAPVTGGTIKQIQKTLFTTLATGTTQSPQDDTIPTSSEGNEYFTLAITPASATNRLLIQIVMQISHNVGTSLVSVNLHQDSISAALASVFAMDQIQNRPRTMVLTHEMAAGSTSEITFKVRAGGSSVGTTTINGYDAARLHGGSAVCSIVIWEYAN
jgi:hypothetical protein